MRQNATTLGAVRGAGENNVAARVGCLCHAHNAFVNGKAKKGCIYKPCKFIHGTLSKYDQEGKEICGWQLDGKGGNVCILRECSKAHPSRLEIESIQSYGGPEAPEATVLKSTNLAQPRGGRGQGATLKAQPRRRGGGTAEAEDTRVGADEAADMRDEIKRLQAQLQEKEEGRQNGKEREEKSPSTKRNRGPSEGTPRKAAKSSDKREEGNNKRKTKHGSTLSDGPQGATYDEEHGIQITQEQKNRAARKKQPILTAQLTPKRLTAKPLVDIDPTSTDQIKAIRKEQYDPGERNAGGEAFVGDQKLDHILHGEHAEEARKILDELTSNVIATKVSIVAQAIHAPGGAANLKRITMEQAREELKQPATYAMRYGASPDDGSSTKRMSETDLKEALAVANFELIEEAMDFAELPGAEVRIQPKCPICQVDFAEATWTKRVRVFRHSSRSANGDISIQCCWPTFLKLTDQTAKTGRHAIASEPSKDDVNEAREDRKKKVEAKKLLARQKAQQDQQSQRQQEAEEKEKGNTEEAEKKEDKEEEKSEEQQAQEGGGNAAEARASGMHRRESYLACEALMELCQTATIREADNGGFSETSNSTVDLG